MPHFVPYLYPPVTSGLQYLTWRISDSPSVFRARGLSMHLVSVVMVYGIVVMLGGSAIAATAAALLFGLDPLSNQPVVVAVWTNTTAAALLLTSFFTFLYALRRAERKVSWGWPLALSGVTAFTARVRDRLVHPRGARRDRAEPFRVAAHPFSSPLRDRHGNAVRCVRVRKLHPHGARHGVRSRCSNDRQRTLDSRWRRGEQKSISRHRAARRRLGTTASTGFRDWRRYSCAMTRSRPQRKPCNWRRGIDASPSTSYRRLGWAFSQVSSGSGGACRAPRRCTRRRRARR